MEDEEDEKEGTILVCFGPKLGTMYFKGLLGYL